VAEIRAERIRKEAAIEVSRVLKVKADREAAEAARAVTEIEATAKAATDAEAAEKQVMDHDKEESEEESDANPDSLTMEDQDAEDEALLQGDMEMPLPEKNRG
jgi:hypothetical protein